MSHSRGRGEDLCGSEGRGDAGKRLFLLSIAFGKETPTKGRAGVSPAMGAGRRGDRPYWVPLGFFSYAKLNNRPQN